ncbi:MAG: hypothetical protein GY952_16745 [Rhodobacteraceae bacterium]|nr:hypothetical protein [Paracoccaceae bacterium]
MSNQPYVILTMKWGTLYAADYVNVLYNALTKHLDHPFRFICMTDDANGIVDGVEIFPIPEMDLGENRFAFGGWPKIAVFQKDLFGLEGRALFVDLDTVITGDIKPMFEAEGGVVLIREWKRFVDHFRPRKVNGMTSIFAFTLGDQTAIYDTFMENPDHAFENYRSEQRWVTDYATDMRFWGPKQVVSFKRDLLAPPLLNRIISPKAPGPETSVVAFHGVPRPIDVVPDNNETWGKWSRWGRGPVKFVRDFWIENGGTDPT